MMNIIAYFWFKALSKYHIALRCYEYHFAHFYGFGSKATRLY